MKMVLSLLIYLLFSLSLKAQRPYEPDVADHMTKAWRWTHISALDGRGVRCIHQARDSSFWFGADGGIIRYNGYDLESWPMPDSLNGLSVNVLYQTSAGTLLVGTNAGLFTFSRTVWKRLFPVGNNLKTSVSDIIELDEGGFIISLGDSRNENLFSGILHLAGEDRYLYTTDKNRLLNPEEETGISWHKLPDHNGILNSSGDRVLNVVDLCKLKNGDILCGISNQHKSGKIIRLSFDQGGGENLHIVNTQDREDGLQIRGSVRISEAQDGSIWVVSNAHDLGVYVFNGDRWESFKIGDTFGGVNSQFDVLAVSDGSVWMEGHGRIIVLREGQIREYKHPDIPVSSAPRIQFYESADQSIWVIGKLNHVFRFDNSFSNWITYNNLNYQDEDDNGRTWYLDMNNRVVYSQYGSWFSFDQDDGLMDTPVRLMVTSYGEVWAVGSHQNTAATAWLDGHVWRMQSHPEVSWGIDSRAAYEAIDGSLWFGCSVDIQRERGHKGGVLQLPDPKKNKENWIHHGESGYPVITSCYGIGQSRDGRLWFGGRPLWTFEGGSWERFDSIRELTEYVDDIYTDPAGSLWLASRFYGVFVKRENAWEHFTMEEGLPSNNVLNIISEKDSSIWITTHGGISHFDGKSWTSGAYSGDLSMVHEGGAMESGRNGFLWINKANNNWFRRGLTGKNTINEVFNDFMTIRYRPDDVPPQTSILPFNPQIESSSEISVFWDGKDYFEKTLNSDLQFSWRLNRDEWSVFSHKKYATFSKLKPGDYMLEVRARDMEFNYDATPAIARFEVLVPWWRRPFVLILIVLTLALISYLQYRIVTRNRILHKLNLDLEQKSEELNLQKQKTESKRDQLESTVKKMEKLTVSRLKFFTNVSHEFRTPLGLIMGPVEDLIESQEGIDSGVRSRYYDIIHRNARRILRLVNQILEVYKVEDSTLSFRPASGDLIRQVKEIVALFYSLAERKGVKLEVSSEMEELELFYDQDKLEKIIFNLLSNAFKNVPDGGSIEVVLECKDDQVCLEVNDNGCGIPEEELPKIFERFYHLESAADNLGHAGMGIGLSYIKDLVKTHRGSIEVKSKPGIETSFRVRIPHLKQGKERSSGEDLVTWEGLSPELPNIVAELSRSILSSPSEYPDIEPEIGENERQDGLKLLIIDDDLDTRLFLRSSFSDDYQVLEAENGKTGLALTRREFPDLVISDVSMPEMDGIAFCETLKKDIDISHIPVILLTAKTMVDDKIRGLETGADAYIEKPFNKRILRSHVQNLIRSRHQLRSRFSTDLEFRTGDMELLSIDEQFLQKVIQIIEGQMDNSKLDAESIARQAAVSRIQLYRKIKALTSQTVNQFIKAIRLKHAARLLLTNSLTISEISYQTGFSAPNHFSTYFKEHFGLSPSEFIERNGNIPKTDRKN